MAEELQHLIDRIQKEAIDQSEAEAHRTVAKAKEKAAALLKEAEAKATARLQQAELDAKVYAERSQRTLEQAARDLLITVGQGIENILEDIVDEAVEKALDLEVLKQMLLKIATAYCTQPGTESRVEFLVSEADQKEIVRFFAEQYRQHLVKGINIHTDNGILQGFRVSFVNEHVYHDFSKPAIAEALSNFLRPHLAEIVHKAAREAGEPEAGDVKKA